VPDHGERRRAVERAVLEEVVDLDPNHLTAPELALKMAGKDPAEGQEILRAIRGLTQVGLLQGGDGVISPTDAALHGANLLIGL
jgi:hypothetical protein